MIKKEQYIEFLNKLSNILIKRISPVGTVLSADKLFRKYLDTEKAEFVIWDNNNMMLKDFSNDWKIYGNDEKEINYVYTNLSMSDGSKFYFNGEYFSCELNSDEQYKILELKKDKNTIIFPLSSNGDIFGLMRIYSEKNAFTKDFFSLLNISSKLISGAAINYLLNEQMEISLNFYKAMKDIAKIIESQYELSYIIPLIGEMIDRFLPAHLIYIFIYKDDKYELVWPSACNDKNIYSLLNNINKHTDYILSDDYKIGAFPLLSDDKILGAIVAYSNIERLFQKDIDYLIQLTRQSGLTIQRANVYAEVLKYATLDALTGLNNRRQFEIRIKQEVSNCKRNNKPLCCMMLDVDYFKKVNDTYGHAAGDKVLKNVSEAICREIREYDIACRYGGEEFFVLLPQTKITEAVSVAQRLRKVIEEMKIDLKGTGNDNVKYINITVSIGVCIYKEDMTSDMFVQSADKALYEAKKRGRNKVITAE